MTRTRRRSLMAGFGSLAAGVVFVTAAYACTPSAQIGLSSDAGMAGTETTVTGSNFVVDRPVELRWNTIDGAVLATATGPSFKVPVKIGDNAPGVGYVVAVQHDVDGRIWKAPAAFEVTLENRPTPRSDFAGSSGQTGGDEDSLSKLGIGLLAVGSVTVLGGFAMAEARRRRRVAVSDVAHH